MALKDLIATPKNTPLTSGLLLYKVSLGACYAQFALLALILVAWVLLIMLSIAGQMLGPDQFSGEFGLIIFVPIAAWLVTCLVQIPFGLYGIAYNRRSIQGDLKISPATNYVIWSLILFIALLFPAIPAIVYIISFKRSAKRKFANTSAELKR